MFQMTGHRLTLQPVIPERDYDVSVPLSASLTPASLSSATGDSLAHSIKLRDVLGEDVKKGLTDPGSERSIAEFLSARSLTSPAPFKAKQLVGSTHGIRRIAEMAHLLRPLLYILLLRQSSRDSWKPFLATLLLDLSTLTVSQTSLNRKQTVLEAQEYKRRSFAVFWYLLKSPLYEKWTSQRLDEFVDWGNQKPLIYIATSTLSDKDWTNFFSQTC
jgi:peroxin-16